MFLQVLYVVTLATEHGGTDAIAYRGLCPVAEV
jgi:hypothetical protein